MRVGIVGTGMIVGMIAPHLADWGIQVTAIAGTPRSAETVERMAQEYGANGRYTDWHDLLADDAVDTVYVAAPNFLHYEVSKAALEAGKDVICEKPLTSAFDEATELAALAEERGRMLWEAVVTTRQPNFANIRAMLPRVGTVKVVTVNYSQYSSRYDAFREGTILPAFDPAKAGGALMDLGLYTLTFTLGLFGEPVSAQYLPNVERNIDTSGIALLSYDGFTAVNVCAKDSGAPSYAIIQGTDGYIRMDSAPNACGAVTLHLNDGTEEFVDDRLPVMWEAEFKEFRRQQDEGDFDECRRQLRESLLVNRIQNAIRREAGIRFPTDPA